MCDDDGDAEAKTAKRARVDRPPVSISVSRWIELARWVMLGEWLVMPVQVKTGTSQNPFYILQFFSSQLRTYYANK